MVFLKEAISSSCKRPEQFRPLPRSLPGNAASVQFMMFLKEAISSLLQAPERTEQLRPLSQSTTQRCSAQLMMPSSLEGLCKLWKCGRCHRQRCSARLIMSLEEAICLSLQGPSKYGRWFPTLYHSLHSMYTNRRWPRNSHITLSRTRWHSCRTRAPGCARAPRGAGTRPATGTSRASPPGRP